MRRFAVALILAVCAAFPAAARTSVAATGSVEVAFTPWDDAEGRIVAALKAAREQILVQANG